MDGSSLESDFIKHENMARPALLDTYSSDLNTVVALEAFWCQGF